MAEANPNGGHQELGNNSSSTLRTTTNDFSNLQVLANQLDGEVTTRDCHHADDYDESGDENNESVEDNNEPQDDVESSGVQRRHHQMNISNDECCCSSSSSQPAATVADGPCQSVIYSNFDAKEDEDGDAGRFETNMEKLNENPNLVLTVDDYDEDVTATTINNAATEAAANMTKLSDSINQQDEQDYIDEDFAPNQLNACSSDDECCGGGCDNFDGQANDEEEEIEDSRLKNNVSKSSSNTDNANVNDFANFDDDQEPKAQNQQNDLTTVNDFNAAAVLTPANSASADKVLFQDSEEPEASSSSSSLPDFGQLKITAAESENKSFVKNIDSTRPVALPKATAPASSSLKFESVSSIEDNSNDLPTTSSAYSSRSQTISECHHQPTDSASSASLAEESTSHGLQNPSSDLTGEYVDQGSSENEAHIWTETEALLLQHEQTSPSACGASAIVNVLKALNFQVDLDAISSKVKINSRIPESMASTTTLAQYLFSRSVAGMNAQELIQNIENITDSQITGRFFAFYPPRDVNLSQWLAHWIRKGAVPVALLNLQKISIWGFIPDAWHHQMIYACDADGVYLTNPIERASIETLMLELTSESVLLVRSQDVIKRFKANNTNLMDLLTMKWTKSNKEKRRWFEMNVLGQVINVLREQKANGDGLGSGGSETAAGDHDLDSSSNDLAATLNQAHQNSSSSEDLNRIAVVVDHHQLMHHQHAGGGAAQPFMADTTNNGYPLQTPPPPPQPSHLGGSTSSSASSSMAMTSYVAIPASYVPGITLFAHRDSQLFNEILSAGELSLKKT